MVWPSHLAFFYPYPGVLIVPSNTWTVWQVTGSATLLFLITFAAIWQVWRRPYLIVGWLWFLGTLVPVIGLVQVGAQAMADRYTYLPLIGVFVMMAWGGKEVVDRRPDTKFATGAAVLVWLAACIVATSQQLPCWQNSETLCRHAIEVTKTNYAAHYNLGVALLEEGQTSEAIKQMYEVVALVPEFNCRRTLAEALVACGRIPEAIEQYRQLLRHAHDSPEVLNNLAWLLATNKDPKIRNGVDAVQFGERACDLTNYKVSAYVGTLAAAYAEVGRFDDAIRTAETAIELASAAGETNLLEKNRQLLELYRAGRPYHETTKL
jgi:Tfp pilus assembly protein PilF